MDTHRETSAIDNRPSHQADNNDIVLPIQLTNSTGTKIQDLNEYCLLEIFSSNSLTPLDLCSLAETCKKFKEITQSVFPSDYKIVVGPECDYYTREYKFQSKNYSGSHKNVQDVERILANFGQYLTALSMHDNDPKFTNSVAKYCDGGSLKRIDIFATGIIEDLSVKFESIFQRLLALTFNGVNTEYRLCGTDVQLNCDSLLELEILYVDCYGAILKNTFPKLRKFIFKQFDYEGSDVLVKFIGRHTCLRSLEWYTGMLVRFHDDFANAIGNGCKELEELTMRSHQHHGRLDLSKLQCLTKLRMLDLEIFVDDYNQVVALFQALKSLEIVKISNMMVRNDVVVALSQLENLRELHLIGCFPYSISWAMLTRLTKVRLINHPFSHTKAEIVDIISQLTNLEELEIYNWENTFVLKEKLYSAIAKIVEQKPNELTLKCKFKFSEKFLKNCNENPKIKLIKLK